jgi:hypothetical protein
MQMGEHTVMQLTQIGREDMKWIKIPQTGPEREPLR